MYFPSYRLRKKCLHNCLNRLVWEVPLTNSSLKGPNTVEICTAAPLSYYLTSAKANESEKVFS